MSYRTQGRATDKGRSLQTFHRDAEINCGGGVTGAHYVS